MPICFREAVAASVRILLSDAANPQAPQMGTPGKARALVMVQGLIKMAQARLGWSATISCKGKFLLDWLAFTPYNMIP